MSRQELNADITPILPFLEARPLVSQRDPNGNRIIPPPPNNFGFQNKIIQTTSMADFLQFFEDHESSESIRSAIPPFLTRQERKTQKRNQALQKAQAFMSQSDKEWNPFTPNESKTKDPFSTIFVGGISYATTERMLERFFDEYGPVKKVVVVKDHNDIPNPKGYAFVEFVHEQDVQKALREARNRRLDGKYLILDVERARSVYDFKPNYIGGQLGAKNRLPKPSKRVQRILKRQTLRNHRKESKSASNVRPRGVRRPRGSFSKPFRTPNRDFSSRNSREGFHSQNNRPDRRYDRRSTYSDDRNKRNDSSDSSRRYNDSRKHDRYSNYSQSPSGRHDRGYDRRNDRYRESSTHHRNSKHSYHSNNSYQSPSSSGYGPSTSNNTGSKRYDHYFAQRDTHETSRMYRPREDHPNSIQQRRPPQPPMY